MDSTAPVFPYAPRVLTRPDADLWDVQRPFPTSAWWTPACLEGGEHTIHPLPYQLKLRRDKATICYPDYMTSEKFVISIFVDRFRVVYYDDLCARFAWKTAQGMTAMESPVVQGSPYVSFYFNNATPVLTSVFALAGDDSGIFTGGVFRVRFNDGQTWMIYASKNITLQFNMNPCVISAQEPFTGVLRIAAVPPQAEAAQLLHACRHIIPIRARTTTSIFNQTLTWVYEFETEKMTPIQDSPALLMMALPHHVQMHVALALPDGDPWYKSIKGPMHGVTGTAWIMKTQIIDVWWDSIHQIDPKRAEVVRGALYAEAGMQVHNTDPYASAKRLAAMGRLAIIADELKEDVIASHIRRRLKQAIDPWLSGTNRDALVYDAVWGGLISTDGMDDPMADYGNGMYNDHHFQYGYFIYAAAAIGKGDKAWLQSRLEPILNLVRDFSNPLHNDPFFPRLRHFDLYAGHSWASGLFVFPDGKNQESSSEAIHAYYAVALLGQVLGRSDLTDLGVALFNLEIISTQNYWHIPNPSTSIYPPPFSQNATVGIVWSGKVDYSTWFGSNLEYIHCIQMLPFTPISELVFTPNWIRSVMDLIGNLKDSPVCESGWRGFIWMAIGVLDKEAAWKGFSEIDGAPDLGNSVANALYWIGSRRSTSSTAD